MSNERLSNALRSVSPTLGMWAKFAFEDEQRKLREMQEARMARFRSGEEDRRQQERFKFETGQQEARIGGQMDLQAMQDEAAMSREQTRGEFGLKEAQLRANAAAAKSNKDPKMSWASQEFRKYATQDYGQLQGDIFSLESQAEPAGRHAQTAMEIWQLMGSQEADLQKAWNKARDYIGFATEESTSKGTSGFLGFGAEPPALDEKALGSMINRDQIGKWLYGQGSSDATGDAGNIYGGSSAAAPAVPPTSAAGDIYSDAGINAPVDGGTPPEPGARWHPGHKAWFIEKNGQWFRID